MLLHIYNAVNESPSRGILSIPWVQVEGDTIHFPPVTTWKLRLSGNTLALVLLTDFSRMKRHNLKHYVVVTLEGEMWFHLEA